MEEIPPGLSFDFGSLIRAQDRLFTKGRRWPAAGGPESSGSYSHTGEEILIAFLPSLLVALLCLANAVVNVGIVSATLDLDGNQISEPT